MVKIPALMATQHPDSATKTISTKEEIDEAIQDLLPLEKGGFGCDEQMIDYEGKLTPYLQVKWIVERMSQEGVVGFVTPRVPNPWLEGIESHLLALLSGLMANATYSSLSPVKYVVYPMSNHPSELASAQRRTLKIAKFLSEETNAKQEDIVLVPLIENVEIMKEINSFYKQYLDEIRSSCGDREGYRIFLGKSDVSLQCGHVASTLAIKKAIYQLWTVNNPPSVILGVGGPPIRGGLLPSLLYHFIENYGGVSTITIQSALRYDHGRNEYAETVGTLRKWINCPPQEITTEINSVIDHASREYQKDLSRVMNGVMTVTPFIPSRRERLTHENYGRVVAGYVLPRAIRFACALYSIGLPPSLLGISILLRNDFPHDIHNFKAELSFDLSFFVPEVAQHYIGHENTSYFVDIVRQLRKEFGIDSTPIPGYENLLMKGIEKPADLSTYLTRAATMRGFLG